MTALGWNSPSNKPDAGDGRELRLIRNLRGEE